MYKSMENTLNGKGYAIQNLKNTQVAQTLNTENKNLFTYEYKGLLLSLIGGLNDNKLDSLTVMLRVERKEKKSPIHFPKELTCIIRYTLNAM